MSPVIRVSDAVYDRLVKRRVEFENPSQVIERLLDIVEGNVRPEVAETARSRDLSGDRIFENKEVQQKLAAVAETLPLDELEALCDKEVSKEIFGISFPLFMRVSDKSNQAKKREAVSINGVNRWTWKYEFSRNGYSYAICTQWYPRNDRPVQAWLAKHGG